MFKSKTLSSANLGLKEKHVMCVFDIFFTARDKDFSIRSRQKNYQSSQ